MTEGSGVAVLGATGSIGTATLDVLHSLGGNWHAVGLSAHRQVEQLANLSRKSLPSVLVVTSDEADLTSLAKLPSLPKVLSGADGLIQLATDSRVDTVVAAIVGSAGLESTLAAAKAGKRIALANKEALVVAGKLLTDSVAQNGGDLLPVDSEHSAIFQALQAGKNKEVARIVLTASGGPFRTWSKERIESATPKDALAHPTWEMGRKITIDSATMINKALEVIEAHWLFGVSADQISVMVHPQSIVHSFVEFNDGSVIAQLSPPDMRLPIQYALTYPDRQPCPCPKVDWQQAFDLSFEPVDLERFPGLGLGWEVIRQGGTSGAVVNACNEAAVQMFLDGQISFPMIAAGCCQVLKEHNFEANPDLPTLMRMDDWARKEMRQWAAKC